MSLALALQLPAVVRAQERLLSGHISDTNGSPVAGVAVLVAGTTTGTTSDENGGYSLELPTVSQNAEIVFECLGFKSQRVSTGPGVLDIVMQEDSEYLDDVVVIGYATISKKDVTTAVVSVSPEELANKPIVSAAEGLQGKAAGVQVILPSGKPGTKPSIRVRGATSVLASNEPLYVIDGIPTNDMSIINPADIETMQVLKDASSSAIYGARAANGVVIITTKKGSKNQTRVNFNGYVSWSELSKKIQALNTEQYLDLLTDMKIAIPEGTDVNRNTDWTDETFGIGFKQNYDLSVSGGNEKATYYMSGSWLSDKGIIEQAKYNRFTLRSNTTVNATDWLKFTGNFTYIRSISRDVPDNKGAANGGVIMSAINTPPFMPIWNPEHPDQYASNPFSGTYENPLANLSNENRGIWNQFLGAVTAEITFFKGLTFKSSFAVDASSQQTDTFIDNVKTGWGRQNNGLATSSRANTYTWLNENILSYQGTFGRHNLNVMLGNSNNASSYAQTYIDGSDFPKNSKIHTVNAANNITGGGSSETGWSLVSFFGRVMYDFDHRYLVTANVRYDGSSKFAPGHKWGVFPSVSAGWRISNEPFFRNVKKISDLKLRVGWGKNGNQEGIGNYAWYGRHSISRVPITDPLSGPAIIRYSLENRDLTWETTTQFNAGIDFGMFHDRLVINLDGYHKKTTGLLLNVPLPASNNVDYLTKNDGEVVNNGFEVNISSKNFVGDFTWNTDLNISTNKNTVTELGLSKSYSFGYISANAENAILLEEGLALGTFYGYNSLGVDPQTGMMIYEDRNGNGYIDPDDRTVIGCAQPKFTYGMTNEFSYKGFSLSIFIQGSYGNDVLNASRMDTEGMYDFRNQSVRVLNRWRNSGDITDVPKASSDGDMWNVKTSSRFVEDGSYLKIKSLTLGYDLPEKVLSKLHISRAQIYVTGYNLFTFTRYSGFDPELNAFGNSGVELGIDYGTYPQSRSFTVGLNLSF